MNKENQIILYQDDNDITRVYSTPQYSTSG